MKDIIKTILNIVAIIAIVHMCLKYNELHPEVLANNSFWDMFVFAASVVAGVFVGMGISILLLVIIFAALLKLWNRSDLL